jgi:cytochrome c biogenesis protein
MKSISRHFVTYSSSLKLTLVLFFIFGASVVAWHFTEHALKDWLITIPLLFLAFNLMAALLTNKIFRHQGWLLLFHIALLLLLLLVGISQITKLIGSVEVTNGTVYDQSSAQWQQGVFHPNRLDKLQFKLEHFVINYEPNAAGNAQRLDTQAYLTWQDEEGGVKKGIVGDRVPLELYGYKLYTTYNKGFAPTFRWVPHEGAPIMGAVHLPAWPANEFNQANDLQIPGTSYKIWLRLRFFDPIFSSTEPSIFRIPNNSVLIVRVGEQRHELQKGQSIEFPTGRLEFLGLNTWMGFQIFYDWSLPWILAVSLLAVFGLGGHFRQKFAPTPWLDEEQELTEQKKIKQTNKTKVEQK